jgi:hypothetical protein
MSARYERYRWVQVGTGTGIGIGTRGWELDWADWADGLRLYIRCGRTDTHFVHMDGAEGRKEV